MELNSIIKEWSKIILFICQQGYSIRAFYISFIGGSQALNNYFCSNEKQSQAWLNTFWNCEGGEEGDEKKNSNNNTLIVGI